MLDTASVLPLHWCPTDRFQIGLLDLNAGKVQQWEIDGWIRKLQIEYPDMPIEDVREKALREAKLWRQMPGRNDGLLAELAFYDHHGLLPEYMQTLPTSVDRKTFEAVLFAWQDGQPLSEQTPLREAR